MKSFFRLLLAAALLFAATPYAIYIHAEEGKRNTGVDDGFDLLTDTKEKKTKKKTKFAPGMAFNLDASYVNRNLENEAFANLWVPGLMEAGGHEHDGHVHGSAGGTKGFNLNYGELILYAAVDDYFDLFTTLHLTEDNFEIEEAYVTTSKLPAGFRLKAGKFLSNFGRLNGKHAHAWSFTDAPLINRFFFGDAGLADVGVQLNWTAPAEFYLGFGVESMQGRNENSFGTESFHFINADTEEEIEAEAVPLPNVWNFFAKTGLELGPKMTLHSGISYAMGKSRMNHLADDAHGHAFAGDTTILGLDLALKYNFDDNRYIALEAEYMHRRMEGNLYEAHEDHAEFDEHDEHGDQHEDEHGHELEVEELSLLKKQSGLYTQLLVGFHAKWRLGARWDTIFTNKITTAAEDQNLPDNLNRYSLMIDYKPSKSTRLRLQYNINRYHYLNSTRQNNNEFFLQLNVTIGNHPKATTHKHSPHTCAAGTCF